MRKKTQHTFSGNVLNIHLPKGWGDLNDDQLHYIAYAMCHFEPVQMKTYVFMRFAGIRVHRKNQRGWICSIREGWRSNIRFVLADWQVESFIHQLDFIEQPPVQPVRLKSVGHWAARDAQLRDLNFGNYLICENLYQGYLFTKDTKHLHAMIQYLYEDVRQPYMKMFPRHRWSEPELLTIFMWWMSVKQYFANMFPHFFRPIDCSADSSVPDYIAQMNIQIRALTGGDVTKEDYVMKMDTWRALTELDAKARDVEEMRERQKQQ